MSKSKIIVSAVAAALGAMPAYSLNIVQEPIGLSSGAPPNVMILYDNSQSMDGTMAGKIVTGSVPNQYWSDNWAASVAASGTRITRGDIARSVLLQIINKHKEINWGLMTFKTAFSPLYYTYAYYFGSNAGMTLTNDCVNGISVSNAGRRCIPDPYGTTAGYRYVTYDKSGDDPDVNDILYTPYIYGGMWGVAAGTGTSYYVNTSSPLNSSWRPSGGVWNFTPTDAGFLVRNPPYTRQLYIPRGWAYNADINGYGNILESIQANSVTHLASLSKYLASETASPYSAEIKNSAVYTPLTGSVASAIKYFNGPTSPVKNSLVCQKNFLLMATDGNPTGRTNGGMYNVSDWSNAGSIANPNSASLAYTDLYTKIKALRSASNGGLNGNVDIQTYVVGLGDSVQNPNSILGLNIMANIGGTGGAYLANKQEDLLAKFDQIAYEIVDKSLSSAAPVLNSNNISDVDYIFTVGYNSGHWTGSLFAYGIDRKNGSVSSSVHWDAAAQLKVRNYKSRNIITYKPSTNAGVAFAWPQNILNPSSSEIDVSQVLSLNRNVGGIADGNGSLRLNYIKGDSSHEALGSSPLFRARPDGVLGDIVDSSPVYIAAPNSNYPDNIESVSYSNYVSDNAKRTPMLLVGANDGMAHAFNATNGSELFAYVPSAVYSNFSQLTDSSYSHKYSVDGPINVGDAFYSGAWHTLAAAGYRGGAKGVYVIEPYASGNSIARWEYNATGNLDDDVGNVWGKPQIAKTNDGKWSLIFGNGYNSASGKAALFVLDIQTGALTKEIIVNSSGSNGLSGVTLLDTNGDGLVDAAYAGDLQGNMWKFDLSGGSSDWKVAFQNKPLFTTPKSDYVPQKATGALTGSSTYDHPSSGTARPITMPPLVVKAKSFAGYVVVFGTGKYIENIDIDDKSLNMEFGIRDDDSVPVKIADLIEQHYTTASDGSPDTSFAVGAPDKFTPNSSTDNKISADDYKSNKKGWMFMLSKDNLTNPLKNQNGERVIYPANLVKDKVISFSTMSPSKGAGLCASRTILSKALSLNFENGNRLDEKHVLDTNGDGIFDDSDSLVSVVTYSGAGEMSQPLIDDKGNAYIYVFDEATGKVKKTNLNLPPFNPHRVSWVQIYNW